MGACKMEGGFIGFDLGKDKITKTSNQSDEKQREEYFNKIKDFLQSSIDIGIESIINSMQDLVYSSVNATLIVSVGETDTKKIVDLSKNIYLKYMYNEELSMVDIHNSVGHLIHEICEIHNIRAMNLTYKGLGKTKIQMKIIDELKNMLDSEFGENYRYKLYSLVLLGSMIYCVASNMRDNHTTF